MMTRTFYSIVDRPRLAQGQRIRHAGRGLLLVLLALLLTACRSGSTVSGPQPNPHLLCGGSDGPACQIRFLVTEPDDGPAPLAQLFNGARKSIDYVPFS